MTGPEEQPPGVREKSPRSITPHRFSFPRLLAPSLICLAALVATSPDLIRGNSCGHDFDFHLASWLDAQSAWRQGLLDPHWAPSPNYGAGEPRFVFYPPLTWMYGAALGLILPWKGVQLAILCSFLAATGLATRALAHQMGLSEGPATLGACASLFSGYSLFTAYERSAFGELAGGFWIPLLLLLILREPDKRASAWRSAFDGSATSLALVIAGAWLSNAPLGVMASYLLAAVACAAALIRRSWAPLLRSLAAFAVGIGISAFYLVPAAVEQRWVQIRQAVDDPGLAVENSFLFTRHADPNLELHDVELLRVSIIAVVMLGIAFASIFVAWRRGRLSRDRSLWVPLACIPLAILLLQLPVSLPLWEALPKLRFLQFPWRWLVTLEAPMGLFFAAAVWPARRWLRAVVVSGSAVLFLGTMVIALITFHQPCDEEDRVSGMLAAYTAGQGFEGTDEYAPPGADNTLIAVGLPDACLSSSANTVLAAASDGNLPVWDPSRGTCEAVWSWERDHGVVPAEHRRLTADIPRSGFLILHLRAYHNWQARLNGKILATGDGPVPPSLPRRDDGLMAIPVEAGHLEMSVDWTATRDQVTGRWLSGFACILLAALRILELGCSSPLSIGFLKR